jgi:hypothetical protein
MPLGGGQGYIMIIVEISPRNAKGVYDVLITLKVKSM